MDRNARKLNAFMRFVSVLLLPGFAFAVPQLSSISPTSIKAGIQLTLTGSGFGATAGSVRFSQNGSSLYVSSFVSWSDTQIVLTVPNGIAPGNVAVDNNGTFSNTIAYTTIPATLGSISPTSIQPGTQLTLTGSGFGTVAGSVRFQAGSTVYAASFVSWSDTQIVLTVPNGVSPGNVAILQNGVYSNAVSYSTIPATLGSISPTSIKPGTQLTLTGSGFGTVAGSVRFLWSSSLSVTSFVSWNDTQIVLAVPSGIRPGSVEVYQNGVYSNTVAYTTIPPTLTSISPASVLPGMQVTFSGTGFGPSQTAAGGVSFNGRPPASLVSWSDTQVAAIVASGTTAGQASVTQNGAPSNGISFSIAPNPSITALSPPSAPVGSSVTISGTNFGAGQDNSVITFNGAQVSSITNWSPTSITATVPATATTGNVVVTLGSVPTNGMSFTVLPTPTISSLAPTSGTVGTSVTISGANFGATQGSGVVAFNGTPATPTSWSATSIVVPVPTGATTGNLLVAVSGVTSNGVGFTVGPAVSISTLSPTSSSIGSPVIITGTNFGTTQGTSAVTFNGIPGAALNWSSTSIRAFVPAGATSGNVAVNVGGVASNGIGFTVIPPPSISSLSPASGMTGVSVTINGTGFGSTQGISTVSFNGTQATPLSWSSSSIVVPVPAGATTGNVIVAVDGVASNGFGFMVNGPQITSVSPSAGAAGTQITISGSGFGNSQGNGTIWLGSNSGTVVSWNDAQVVASVKTGSESGFVQVRQNGSGSNTVLFTVNTPTITSISPTTGIAGTQVVISGSGFGITQGTGQVWLGTANGSITSWSDAQVVATVSAGSTSGNAQVLQNGVWSNAVPFNINLPHVSGISPNSGSAGTLVTVTGSGFGASQGGGTVWIGNALGQVAQWTDTQVTAYVANTAISGIVKVQQNGTWSNSLAFAVPPIGGGAAVSLVPNVISMVVGDTRSIQALDNNGNPVTGLSWSSSNTDVVTLSTDDPPIITAVSPGNVTITGGQATADLTIYAGPTFPTGTTIWSNAGDGSGVYSIMPAVPSSTGVADVFALQASGNVQAVKSDGTVGWTSNVGVGNTLLPDFQGGLIVANYQSVYKLDGLTGQPKPSYTYAVYGGQAPLIHTDGTIFTVDNNSIVGLDSSTGQVKFSIALEQGTYFNDGDCGEFSPISETTGATLGQPIIAGDGNAYYPYYYVGSEIDTSLCVTLGGPGSSVETYGQHRDIHSRLLRIATNGSANEITIGDWSLDTAQTIYGCGNSTCETDTASGSIPSGLLGTLITNADQGVLYSWAACYYNGSSTPCTPQFQLTTVTNGSPSTLSTSLGSADGSDLHPVQPVLQRQDGMFLGINTTMVSGSPQTSMVAFDQYGNQKWSVPNYTPKIATSDGGLIAESTDGLTTSTFDASGNSTGQLASLSTQSWIGNAYQIASVTSVQSSPVATANSFWALVGGNASGTATAIQQVLTNQSQDNQEQLPSLSGASCISTQPNPLPTCGNVNAIELLTSVSPDLIFQTYIQTFSPVAVNLSTGQPNNGVMVFTGSGNTPINVTGAGQKLTIGLRGVLSLGQGPFSVLTERFDPSAHVISVVTLKGHPLAGWRYWRVYSIGTNDVVIETGAYDQPGPGLKNYVGYYLGQGTVSLGWRQYLKYIQQSLGAPEGTHLRSTVGGIQLTFMPGQFNPEAVLDGYWDYWGDFTSYILNNVCESTSCN
jgi:hypothetical protein